MFDRIRTFLSRLHDAKEVNALSQHDLQDIGLSREQLLEFVAMPRDVPQRVTAMAQIFGVSEPTLKRDHGQWLDLLSVCGQCADRAACGHVLAKGDQAQPSEAGFCGNSATFAQLAV